ncbi:MAG TPA: EAL domain-containing protein [Polyangiaceae bacterium]|nr:EAL domain-containing protein [Polyangiaceae bacterium]
MDLTLGVLMPYTGGFYYGNILAGIQRVARQMNARVIAVHTNRAELSWPSDEDRQFLALGAVDAWIAVNEFSAADYTNEIVRRGIPIVSINARLEGVSNCSVTPDNVESTRRAVEHLLEHGHRRIAFAGSRHQLDLRERHQGYVEAHRAAGVALDDALHFETAANLELDGHELGRRLVRNGLPCTAIVAGTDKLALGLMSELCSSGIRVPGDVALIGFDDIDAARYAEPPLTTIRQNFGELAAVAAKSLIAHLREGKPLPPTIRVPTRLVLRRSCGCTATHALPESILQAPTSERHTALVGALKTLGESEVVEVEAMRIADAVFAAMEHQLAFDDAKSAPLWNAFLAANRGPEGIDRLLALLESTVEAWWPSAEQRPLGTSLLRRLRISLLAAWQRSEQRRTRSYEYLAESRGKINAALNRINLDNAPDLGWLAWTPAEYACLALWEDAAENRPRRLRLVSEYFTDRPVSEPILSTIAPAGFPLQVLELSYPEADLGSVVTVAPVPGPGSNRGLLMVVAAVEIELLDHLSNVGDWAAQLGAALDRAEIEQRLRQNALHDPLTGLPNRALLLETLQGLMARPVSARPAVLFLDLDDFKQINDSMGHAAGDQALVEVAQRLRAALDPRAIVARLGGDEFVIVVPEADTDEVALDYVRRIQEALRRPFSLNGETVFLSLSIGVSLASNDNLKPAELLRDADTAMYRAKVQGRGKYELFENGMHAQAVERLRLDSRLRQALERGEFLLRYQPIVSATGRIDLGAEALLRWNHPDQGLVGPGRFLAVAEDVGLAIPISEWVLATACREAARWQQPGRSPRYVNVNVPAEHLEQPDFVPFLVEQLEASKLSPKALGIEIVESSLVRSAAATIKTLSTLMEMGVRVAVDDFGTGYSSLSYLRDLPVSVVKIDRRFVENLPQNAKDGAIVSAIVTMGRGLGLTVVAEGVETEGQLEFLRNTGCDHVQGYLLGRPLSVEDWQRRLRSALNAGSQQMRSVQARTSRPWLRAAKSSESPSTPPNTQENSTTRAAQSGELDRSSPTHAELSLEPG